MQYDDLVQAAASTSLPFLDQEEKRARIERPRRPASAPIPPSDKEVMWRTLAGDAAPQIQDAFKAITDNPKLNQAASLGLLGLGVLFLGKT